MSYQAQKALKQNLYRLKRAHGIKVDIYEVIGAGRDYETGEMTREYNVWTVKRAILLPQDIDLKYSYDLTFLASNKNFQMGGLYEVGMRRMIIDRADLPKTLEIRMHYNIVYNREKYEIAGIQEHETRQCYLLTLRDTKARRPEQVLTEESSQVLGTTEDFNAS